MAACGARDSGYCAAWKPAGPDFDADFSGCWSILVVLCQSLPRIACGAARHVLNAPQDLSRRWEQRNVIGAKGQ